MDIDISAPQTYAKQLQFLRALTGDGLIKGVSCKEITIDPPSLTTGAAGTITGSFIGASVGDGVVLIPPYDMQQIGYSGSVSAADTIEVMFHSANAGTIDLASGTWLAIVFHRA